MTLSKSKLIAFRQCPKRLWLEIHRPELRDDSGSQMAFAIGNSVGEISQRVLTAGHESILCDPHQVGWSEAYQLTQTGLHNGTSALLEAAMRSDDGALALADVMLPQPDGSWSMVEVKASTSVKDYHHDDAAIQSHVFRSKGFDLHSVGVATINNQFVYPGDGDYDGLFNIEDLTEECLERAEEVKEWIADANACAALSEEPEQAVGPHCHDPFDCPFMAHCKPPMEAPEFPLSSLPRLHPNRRAALEAIDCEDLRDAPDHLLSWKQQRVKQACLSGEAYFDQEGARAALEPIEYPAYFLDFETVMLPVPIWKGTRPYQQIPFQFSLHRLDKDAKLTHEAFLNLSGDDPTRPFIESVIQHCGGHGPIYTYNAKFERMILKQAGERHPEFAETLAAINARMVDLHPVAENHFYHPSQHGSWSLKAVLPALCPDLNYADLEGVQHGGAAVDAYQEAALNPNTTPERKAELKKQLLDYCELDTLALVRLREVFLSS